MKMSAAAVVLLLLCCFSSSDSKDVCDQYAAVGDSVTIQLKYEWTDSGVNGLKWWRDYDNIIYRRGQKFITQKTADIDQGNGSLKLTNVMKADEGGYTPQVYKPDGTSAVTLTSIRLCVLERVQKPEVKFMCQGSKKENVEFTCTPDKKDLDVKFQWLQKDKVVATSRTLKRESAKVENEVFTCNVSNEVSFAISESITQNCSKSGGITFPEKVFGIDIWIIVGGGAGIVLLLIILVIICCLRARRTKRMRLKDEGEFRLQFTRPEQHPQYSHPADRHQHHQHQHRHHQQQPAGHTGPRQHRSKQHRNQPLPKTPDQANGAPQPSPRRSAQPPKPANDEQPPPLPQPRKKAPKKV
ncbi:T-cell surface antigen CD2 [Acanthochromis polyacanthus]|uniref:T-cell surface antigen CD2 n=1 Tax=Acanthochromis polyacanthus TaxID=80966 RepID=UPI002234C8A6|nr:T-cell surface antigen CD2 [Acanthochromis polyacanthus]XP_051797740.1 T-cell surface antigen CD2 [Acanthochromis polyacanthus]